MVVAQHQYAVLKPSSPQTLFRLYSTADGAAHTALTSRCARNLKRKGEDEACHRRPSTVPSWAANRGGGWAWQRERGDPFRDSGFLHE